ncbi:MAG TPA: glycosyltransferase family 1 protein [Lentisphaeria bacterium]|nr:glycosyltransferase family 1 protein [Lentisphaeria bacterium]
MHSDTEQHGGLQPEDVIPVDLLLRRRPGTYSIERVFQIVADALPATIKTRWLQVPAGPWRLPDIVRNLLWCLRHCGRLVHVTGDVHYCVLALPGRRVVLTVHDLLMLTQLHGWRRRVVQKLWFDWPLRRCDIVTCISEQTKRELLALDVVKPDKIVVVPDPLSPDFVFCEQEFCAACPRILHFNVTANKNLLRSIDALAGLPCQLRIIGQLSDAQRARLAARRIDYSNAWNLSDRDIIAEYQQCDLLLFPSLSEGFGMPIIEAQATGRPVVTSNRQPMVDTAGAAGAALVDPDNPTAIRAAIDRVIGDDDYRRGLVAAGRKNAARFAAAAIARRYSDIYRQLQAP